MTIDLGFKLFMVLGALLLGTSLFLFARMIRSYLMMVREREASFRESKCEQEG